MAKMAPGKDTFVPHHPNHHNILIDDDDEEHIREEEEREEDEGDEDDFNKASDKQPLIDGHGSSLNSLITNGSTSGAKETNHISIGTIKIYQPRRKKINRFCRHHFGSIIAIIIAIIVVTLILSLRKRNDFLGLRGNRQIINKGCEQVDIVTVWNKTFPMLTIESAFRLIDANNDSVDDTIIGFGTGVDAASYPDVVCQIYFSSKDTTYGCGGGLMALDGNTGQVIWERYTKHEIFAVNCQFDVTGDGIKDCIVGGRMASLYAIDGFSGEVIWTVYPDGDAIVEISNFYTPLYMPKDLDEDGVPDLIIMHGGDPLRSPHAKISQVARLLIMSARKGSILNWALVPDNVESYYSPQLLSQPDGTTLVMFGTGGEAHAGSLWIMTLEDLISGKMHNAKAIYTDCCKGVMVPPAITDMNKDGIADIIMASFNSTVMVFDGLNFELIWKRHFPSSETYSTPAIGRFNYDDTPDVMVIYQYGPGFPIYYKTEVHVLDGKDGKTLLREPITMDIGTQSSPLTLSTNASTDLFTTWYVTCAHNHQQRSSKLNASSNKTVLSHDDKYEVMPGTRVHDSSRANFCKLRFNTTFYSQYWLLSPSSTTVMYDSRQAESIEDPHIDTSKIGQRWYQEYGKEWEQSQPDYYSVPASFNYDTKLNAMGALPQQQPQQQQQQAQPQPVPQQQPQQVLPQQPQPMFAPNYQAPMQDQLRMNQQQLGYNPMMMNYGQQQQQPQQQAYYPYGHRPLLFGAQNWPQAAQTNSMNDANDQLWQKIRDSNWDSNAELRRRRPRLKRHIGPHDGEGVQRTISTGTLAAPLTNFSSGSIDIVFGTYWFPASKNVQLMSPEMKACIDKYSDPEKEAEIRLKNPQSQYYNIDHDAYRDLIKEFCAQELGLPIPTRHARYEIFNRQMGAMTIYRKNIKCRSTGRGKSQYTFLPYDKQWWPAYMGKDANSLVNIPTPN